jgi:hypothetical protein
MNGYSYTLSSYHTTVLLTLTLTLTRVAGLELPIRHGTSNDTASAAWALLFAVSLPSRAPLLRRPATVASTKIHTTRLQARRSHAHRTWRDCYTHMYSTHVISFILQRHTHLHT